jgi:GT2 family glycosyltransferase
LTASEQAALAPVELVPLPARPRVAVIVPNYNGRHHLATCLESLAAQRAAAELVPIVVDNGSSDGSAAFLEQRFPSVRVLRLEVNRGFAAACNAAARAVEEAEVLAFLNNDMRVEQGWLERLLVPLVAGEAECSTSRIVDWEGRTIDFAGGGMNFHGIGIARGHGEPDGPRHAVRGPSLFGCGGSMAIRRDVFLAAGGFDEEFFAYYEDVDLGWRLWVLGHRVAYEPASLAYHHLSATSRTFGYERVRLLQVRNPLCALVKNYGERAFQRILPAALLLTAQRTFYMARLPVEAFRIELAEGGGSGRFRELLRKAREGLEDRLAISKVALADLVALHDFGLHLPRLLRERASIQARRRREDREIFRLFHDPFWAVEPPEEYAALQRLLCDEFGIRELFEEP